MKKITLAQAFIPIIVLVILLAFNVLVYGSDSLEGSNQFVLLIGAGNAIGVGAINKVPYGKMMEGIGENLKATTSAILILLLVGALSGTWLLSGIIPAMIYYGLEVLNPSIFLMATVIITAIISLATGSSWTTSATIGIALIGIGKSMGISEGIVAGAVVSGAYFGDKISPMSDTTNLASAITETDLFTHIKYMLYTTSVSLGITLIIFLFMGFFLDFDGMVNPENIQNEIKSTFNISPWLLIVPLIVVGLILMKTKPLVALMIGVLLGGAFSVIFQSEITNQKGLHYRITKEVPAEYNSLIVINTSGNRYDAPGEYELTSVSEEYQAKLPLIVPEYNQNKELNTAVKKGGIYHKGKKVADISIKAEPTNKFLTTYFAVIDAITVGTKIDGSNTTLGDLFKSGGMAGMLQTVWLIICAMTFGGVMEAIGALRRISEFFLSIAKTIFGLFASTVATCIGVNIFAADQYLSIVVPGKMYSQAYKDKGLASENLSRTLEDSGTATSVLVPWNTCGAYHSKVLLGEAGLTSYIPYAFFNLLSPFVTLTFAAFKIKIRMLKDKK